MNSNNCNANNKCLNYEAISNQTSRKISTFHSDKDSKLSIFESSNNVEGGLRIKKLENSKTTNSPLITIVTVSYNSEKFIKETINSVLNQNSDDIEYIIIDGGSTDKTIEIIKNYNDMIDYWISEPDAGQSDALIKGFKLARGEWLCWVNSDDILLPNAIIKLKEEIKKHPKIEWFTGNSIWTDSSNHIIQCRQGEYYNRFLAKVGILVTYGPSCFFKRSLYYRTKGINKELHYMMDTDLWWQFHQEGAAFRRIDGYVWTLRMHSNAKMSGHHFNAELADSSHASWLSKSREHNYILSNYKLNTSMTVKITGRVILSLTRITSLRYLIGLWDTIIYKNKIYSVLSER
jgi:glycosyltransferase involved in cell wall biosynthesis